MAIANFTDNEVSKKCFELKLIESHLFSYGSEATAPENVSPKAYIKDLNAQLKNPRARYKLTIMLMSSALHQIPQVASTPPHRRALI